MFVVCRLSSVLRLGSIAVAIIGFTGGVFASEVVHADSFTMLNIIPSMPGREEVAAADAIGFVERTGNPYCLYSMTLHPQGKPASRTVDAAVESYM